ncbi:MAG: hypothetical protein K5985_04365 [Lachnospiraceae bacterium]|nr:hypothetical protein [Lachnospiraceae bacterium]
MQGLDIAEAGLSYTFRCIKLYSGASFYLALFFPAVIFLWFYAPKTFRAWFAYPALVMLLTIFNPLLPVLIDRFFDVNNEFYRFLWAVPVVITVSASLTVALGLGRTPGRRVTVFLSSCCFLIALGSFVYRDGFIPAVNSYKIQPEVLAVSELIHADSDVEYPRAICDFDMEMEIRQYDGKILLAATREEYLNALSGTEVDENIAEKQKHPNRILKVVALEEELPVEEFQESLEETGTEYVVLSGRSPLLPYLERAGLKEIGSTPARVIYRYTLKERTPFELADYTDVWEAQ